MRTIWLFALVITTIAIPTVASAQSKANSVAKQPAKVIEAAPANPAAPAQPSSEDSSATPLPVRKVILYKTGVGYFEHLGQVRGDQKIGIDFTSRQLNDVLQSLTVLDLNGGRIAGVNYNSEASLKPTARNAAAAAGGEDRSLQVLRCIAWRATGGSQRDDRDGRPLA